MMMEDDNFERMGVLGLPIELQRERALMEGKSLDEWRKDKIAWFKQAKSFISTFTPATPEQEKNPSGVYLRMLR